jgi:hypothetical protein
MTQLLIQGSAILAQEPITETEAELQTRDQVIPKHLIEGWQIVDVTLPEGFSMGRYEYNQETQSCALTQAAQDADKAAQIASLKERISEIEGENPVTLRGQRELSLLIREMIKQVVGEYPNNYGFNKAVEIETQVASLRSQIQTLGG